MVVSTGVKLIVASFDPSANALAKPTVVRTRGDVALRASSVAADTSVIGAYGVAIVNTDAFVAGIASIPGPFDDAGWDGWFVWRSFSLSFEFGDSTGFGLIQMNQEVDSKAMWKISDNETMVLIAESQSGAYQISMPLRFLLKLS